MRRSEGAFFLFMLGVMALPVVPLEAKEEKRPVAGPLITIRAPHAQQFEISMDEAELDWSRVPGVKGREYGRQASPVGDARIVESGGVRARVVFGRVTSTAELEAMVTALQRANPGADAYLVLYELGRPKSKWTRRLLTREVGLIMAQGEDPKPAIAGLPVATMRPVANTGDGYVIEATHPLAALELAETLLQRPGVRSAYPLLKRSYIPR